MLDFARGQTAEGEAVVGDFEVVPDGDAAEGGEADAGYEVEAEVGDVWEVGLSVGLLVPCCCWSNGKGKGKEKGKQRTKCEQAGEKVKSFPQSQRVFAKCARLWARWLVSIGLFC